MGWLQAFYTDTNYQLLVEAYHIKCIHNLKQMEQTPTSGCFPIIVMILQYLQVIHKRVKSIDSQRLKHIISLQSLALEHNIGLDRSPPLMQQTAWKKYARMRRKSTDQRGMIITVFFIGIEIRYAMMLWVAAAIFRFLSKASITASTSSALFTGARCPWNVPV